ncbi:MAG: hypothetical protein SF069_16295 [Phycisphaerae bacterium]|nr:hypothetical protein [Phycisphaerae bacterium]
MPFDIEMAECALRQAFAGAGELVPSRVARAAARALPREAAAEFLRRLRGLGLVRSGARVAVDVLDGPACRAAFPGSWGLLARLAVFGLPGQGQSFDKKHRDALFQRFSSEIMREGVDLPRLQRIAQRVLGHRDVAPDAVLVAMLRSIVTQKEAELRVQQQHLHQQQHDQQVQQAQQSAPAAPTTPSPHSTVFFTREQVRGMLQRQAQKFEDHTSQYEELAAENCLRAIEELGRKYPVHIESAAIQHYREAHEAFLQRCAAWRQAIEGLAERGEEAAAAGDERTAAWVIRRLHAIHALRPGLLNEPRLDALCKKIQQAEDTTEEREAAEELIAREKEIAAEVRGLAQAVRRFHNVARQHAPESVEFKAAADDYRAAVRAVHAHDQEWLTSIFMELEDLVSEVHDDSGQAESQINTFIDHVRTALIRIRDEIRSIHAERLDQQ